MKDFFTNFKYLIYSFLFRILYASCRWQIEGIEHLKKVVINKESAIIAYWHGNMLIPYYKLAKYKFHVLAGFHRDAELGVKIGEKLGWQFFRGSSSKRGSEAFQEIMGFLQIPGRVFVITPDGPKGPARTPKPGAVRASQKLGIPIIPIGARSKNSWGFTNWDTFHVAKPFTKIIMKIGKPLNFNKDMDFEGANNILMETLNDLEQSAKNSLEK